MSFREGQPAKISNRRGAQAARVAAKDDGNVISTSSPPDVLPSLISPAVSQLSRSAIFAGFMNDVLAAAAEQCASPGASLWRYEKGQNTLCLQALYRSSGLTHGKGANHPLCRPGRRLKTGALWQELSSRRVPIILNVAEDRCILLRKLVTFAERQHLLLLPLTDQDTSIGLIGVELPESNAREPGKIEIARLLSQQIVTGWKLADLLDRKLYSVIFEERKRIARDLHDTLAQSFTSILIQIDLAEEMLLKRGQQKRQHLVRMRQLAHDGLIDVRRAVFGLQPQSLENCCLVEALAQLTADFNSASDGMQAEFSPQCAASAVPIGTQGHLLRIAQESLTNVLKHGHATKVRIKLTADDHCLQLSICDDGTGFNLSGRGMTKGFGLKGMEERVSLIGGRLSVSSQTGSGTQIQVTVPLEAGQAPRKQA